MSRRKYILLLLSVFALCAALLIPMLDRPGSTDASFGDHPSGDQPPKINHTNEAETVIRIAMSVSDAEFRYWQEECRKFDRSNPGLQTELVNFPAADAASEWKRASQIGKPFDVMLLGNGQVADFAVNGYLDPADDVMTGNVLSDQLEALTAPLKWNGSLWGVPLDSNPAVIAWHSGLLKAAGLNAPPTEWSAFAATVLKLQTEKPELAAVNVDLSDPAEAAAWLGAFDNSAAQAAALQTLGATAKQQLRFAAAQGARLASLDPHTNGAKLLELFKSGKLLSAVMPWSDYISIAGDAQGLLRFGDKPETLVWTGGRSFVVSAQSKSPREAGRWIDAMTTTESELARYSAFGTLPARRSAYSLSFGLSPGDAGLPQSLLALLSRALPSSDPQWQSRYDDWSALLGTLAAKPFGPDEAERLIRLWNGEWENGAFRGAVKD